MFGGGGSGGRCDQLRGLTLLLLLWLTSAEGTVRLGALTIAGEGFGETVFGRCWVDGRSVIDAWSSSVSVHSGSVSTTDIISLRTFGGIALAQEFNHGLAVLLQESSYDPHCAGERMCLCPGSENRCRKEIKRRANSGR